MIGLKDKFADLPDLLTTNEAAEITRMSAWSIRKLAREGAIPSVKISSRVLIPKSQLIEQIESSAIAKAL